MIAADKLAWLQAWARNMAGLDAQLDRLTQTMGLRDDSPAVLALCRMADAYTDAVGELVGDRGEWLSWWHHENDMGAAGLTVELSGRAEPMAVPTVSELLELIALAGVGD